MIVAREIALLAAELGRVHRARGELDRAQQIETELGAELAQIEAALDRERPRTGEDLDAEAQAAKRAREPLPPPARDPGRQGAGETEDVKRLINPLRGAGDRGGGRTGCRSPSGVLFVATSGSHAGVGVYPCIHIGAGMPELSGVTAGNIAPVHAKDVRTAHMRRRLLGRR